MLSAWVCLNLKSELQLVCLKTTNTIRWMCLHREWKFNFMIETNVSKAKNCLCSWECYTSFKLITLQLIRVEASRCDLYLRDYLLGTQIVYSIDNNDNMHIGIHNWRKVWQLTIYNCRSVVYLSISSMFTSWNAEWCDRTNQLNVLPKPLQFLQSLLRYTRSSYLSISG